MYNSRMQGYNSSDFNRIGIVARWKPVHLGHAAILKAMCRRGGEAIIGIGSSNRYNARNPFTLDETQDMIRLVLDEFDNFVLVPIPDLDDGPRWRDLVRGLLGPVDLFLTENPYVRSLLVGTFRLEHPSFLLSGNEQIAIDGTSVRKAIAKNTNWKDLLPKEVTTYILDHHLEKRLVIEFGLEILASETIIQFQ